MFTLQYCKCVS
jgi:KUP system potassium uptake protein